MYNFFKRLFTRKKQSAQEAWPFPQPLTRMPPPGRVPSSRIEFNNGTVIDFRANTNNEPLLPNIVSDLLSSDMPYDPPQHDHSHDSSSFSGFDGGDFGGSGSSGSWSDDSSSFDFSSTSSD